MKITQSIAIIIFTALLFSILTSCNEKNVNNDSVTIITSSQNTTIPVIENAEIDYYKNLPGNEKFNSDNFTFFLYDVDNWKPYIDVEQSTGEVLNDAAYKRNSEVSELLGIEFSFIKKPYGDMVSIIQKDNAAGDCPYDLALFWASTNIAPLIAENQVHNWMDIPYIDLKADWYNQDVNDSFTINNKQYIAVSDLSFPIQQHWRYLFNKTLCRDLGLEYPYQLVYDGKWTLDTFNKYLTDVYMDINGDGIKSAEDRYGFSANYVHISRSIFNWGEFPLSLDKNGFKLNIFNEKISSMVGKLSEFKTNKDTLMLESGSPYDMFDAGRVLFEIYSSDPNTLRSVEVDYGYLPYPKFNEQQKDYITLSFGGLMIVPFTKTEDDLKRIGAVVEALSAGSGKYVADAFISQYIENKVLRDEDSVNMYRLMRNTAKYDNAMIYDTTNMLNNYQPFYVDAILNQNLASKYEQSGPGIQKALDDIYKTIIANQ